MRQPKLIDISSKWVPPRLMPKCNRPVLVQSIMESGTYMGIDYKYNVLTLRDLTAKEKWEDEKNNGMLRWCYVDDILPR